MGCRTGARRVHRRKESLLLPQDLFCLLGKGTESEERLRQVVCHRAGVLQGVGCGGEDGEVKI